MNPYQYACSKFEGHLIKPYQSDGVRWMIAKELDITPGGILCDEMGLGKTAQTICTMLADRKFTNTLIVCPKSVVTQWETEIKKFAPSLRQSILIHTGASRSRNPEELKKYKVVITTMGTILPRKNCLQTTAQRVAWYRVIVDEAHDMRNAKSKTYRAVWALNARIRWCLTATPVFNKVIDFSTLMEWVGVPRVHVKAGMRQCVERYVLRRTKEEVGIHNEKLQLPPCDVENVLVKLSKEEEDLYVRIFNHAQAVVARANEATNAGMYVMELLTQYLRCRQCLAYPPLASKAVCHEKWEDSTTKLDVLMKRLEEHPTEKSLIFCNFRGEMDAIQQACQRKVYRIDGSFDEASRKKQVKDFHEDETGAIFVIQIKAGGVGLNLQGATRIYLNSPSWNPATEIQAIGRAHRTGQTKRVKVCRLITENINDEVGSMEQKIVMLQVAKSMVFQHLVDNVGDMGKLSSVMGSAPNMEALKEMFDTNDLVVPTLQKLSEIVD